MKNWKVKEEGGFFTNEKKRFETEKEAMNWIKDNLPRGGIFSQSIHHKLFERSGLFTWKLKGCYIRDTVYTTENGEDVAEPLDNVVKACEHVKKHLDELQVKGITKCNAMFGIRANYLNMFCKKGCESSSFKVSK